jgi:hypothetical protein
LGVIAPTNGTVTRDEMPVIVYFAIKESWIFRMIPRVYIVRLEPDAQMYDETDATPSCSKSQNGYS